MGKVVIKKCANCLRHGSGYGNIYISNKCSIKKNHLERVNTMTTLNISELSARLDTDPRTTRKFLRAITPIDAQPGKGSRWVIEAKQVVSLNSKFKKFTAANDQAKLDREAAKGADAAPTAAEALDDLGFDDPTDEQIDDMQGILDDEPAF